MVNTIAIGQLTLPEIVEKQHLQLAEDSTFAAEWRSPLPDITADEQRYLDQVQQDYLDQARQGNLSEGLAKLIVISPLLHLAGFYRQPYEVRLEQPVQLDIPGQGEIWLGRIDALVIQEQLWLLVVESKGSMFGIDQAIPQALGYMFAAPEQDMPLYGLVTNGSSYAFLKLVQQPKAIYSVSDVLLLLPGRTPLHQVLAILKKIGHSLQPAK